MGRHKAGWHDTALTSPMQPLSFAVCLSNRAEFAVCLSNRAEFCSLSTKFEEVQYNIVMRKRKIFFFSFLTITEETTH